MMKILVSAAMMAACGVALAKLPPLDDAAKAKAAEAAARAAWTGKVGAYQLCKVQDKIAARYRTAGASPVATPVAVKPSPTPPATPVAAPASGTPVAATPPAPCQDPGPFAYTSPEQKPIEAAGAHSPPGTASSPPSTKTPAAAVAPAKKS